MKFFIKQRVFSWSDTYDIYDETGNTCYFVKAEAFSFGHQIHIYNAADCEVAAIHQKFFTFLPAFEIEIHGRAIGTIRKKFSFFCPQYEIDYNGWKIEGNFLGWDYDVYNGNRQILHITKELLHWGDTYTIDIADSQDELEGILLVIAIDAANCGS